MTTRAEVTAAIEEARQHWAGRGETVAKVAKFLNWTTSALADQMGMTRSTLTGRLKGHTAMEPAELRGFSLALGVPVHVLEMEPNQAVRWVIDHNVPNLRNRCYAVIPQAAA